MTDISYCDNTNCIYNKNFKCTYPKNIILDENATCLIAQYKNDAPKTLKDTKDKSNKLKHPKENDWFKIL